MGYSDHSIGSLAAVMSIVMGAKLIEKHFTLDKTLPGPDHKASSTPDEFSELVTNVRRAEKMLGNPIKTIQDEEIQMSKVSRKSIVAACNINAGEIFDENNLTLKRPGTGLLSVNFEKILGEKASKKIDCGELINWSDVICDN